MQTDSTAEKARSAEVDGRWYIYKSFPAWNWIVAYTVPLEDKHRVVEKLDHLLVLVMVGITSLSIIGIWVAITKITRPIAALAQSAKAIADGEYSAVLAQTSSDEVGHLTRDFNLMTEAIRHKVQELNREISERHQAETALRKEQAFLGNIMETSPVGILMTDLNGRITFANPQATATLGVEQEAITRLYHNSPEWKIVDLDGDPLPEEDLPFTRVTSTGKAVYEIQFSIIRPDGERVSLSVNAAPYRDERGAIAGVVASLLDITAQKRLEGQIRQTEKMQAIGLLAGGVAHDFNNQLSGVLGYADLLIYYLKDEKLAEYARNIQVAAERATELTAQLLAFSRKGKYLSAPVEVNALLDEVTTILERSIDKRITLHRRTKLLTGCTLGDPSQLQNAFLNLAINACDAMPGGGELTFEVDSVRLDEQFCESQPLKIRPGTYIQISVADTGMGMDGETQKHIFEPFFTTKEEGKGTGLGLASVYGAVRNHKGLINVYSELGKGTTFRVYLPLTDAPQPVEPSHERKLERTGSGTILVVDDEQVVRDLGCEMLRKLGYHVLSCSNGQEAIEYYQENWRETDLVVLDINMPRLGGRDTFTAMRQINPKVRVVLASGFSIDGEAQAILDEGALGFVAKPFKWDELSQAVAQALQA